MTLGWLAAALSPRDIASHPNFSHSTVGRTPQQALADVLLPSRTPYEGASSIEFGRSEVDAALCEAALTAARDLLSASSIRSAAERLAELARQTVAASYGPAFAGSMALLAAMGFAELDEHDSAFSVLNVVIGETHARDDPEAQLICAACLQQRALRLFDVESAGGDESERVIALLSEFDPKRASHFDLSPGVSWTSDATVANIVQALTHGARRLQAHVNIDDRDWVNLIKEGPPLLLLRNFTVASESYDELIQRVFSDKGVWGQRRRFSGSASPDDSLLWEASTSSELLGHPSARTLREDLALFRLLDDEPSTWSVQDALRLLRHARSRKYLATALSRVRSGGPLSALRGDALQVLRQRLPTGRVGVAELTTIRIAAGLFTRDEASEALRAVLSLLDARSLGSDPLRTTGREWRADSLLTALELAPVCDGMSDVAHSLLGELLTNKDKDDLLDQRYSEVVSRLDWSALDGSIIAQWQTRHSQIAFPAARQRLGEMGVLQAEVHVEPEKAQSLESIARQLNAAVQDGTALPAKSKRAAEALLSRSLTQLEADVSRGAHAFGGVAPLDLAVAFSLSTGSDALWPVIWRILSNPSVLRAVTEGAFERLARNRAPIPAAVRGRLAEISESLLSANPGPFENDLVPYPAALRFLITNGFLDEQQALARVSVLSAGRNAFSRLEAARTMTTLLLQGSRVSWIVALTVNLSYDTEAIVQAEACRSLVIAAQANRELRAVLYTRVAELLDKDGGSIPLFALVSLREYDRSMSPSPIRAKVGRIAERHPLYSVRVEAEEVVSKWRLGSRE